MQILYRDCQKVSCWCKLYSCLFRVHSLNLWSWGVKFQLFREWITKGLWVPRSFYCGDLALINSFVVKSATFVNKTRPRGHRCDVISSQQGFRLQLYFTCISIRAEQGLTLQSSVLYCFYSDDLTLISLFDTKFSWIDHFTVPWVDPGLWMKVRLEVILFWWRPPSFSYVNDAVLMLININLHSKSSEVSIKTRSPPSLIFT